MTTTTDNFFTESKNIEEKARTSTDVLTHAQIAEIIKLQYGGLLSLLRRKLKDRELAADLVNEAIAVTLDHARLGRLTQLESIGGYVFKVSMNLLRNYQRNTNNRQDLRSDVAVLDTLALYERDEIEATQAQKQAQHLIESLTSTRDREILKRFYLDEEDKQAICDDLKITPLHFTQLMSRARQRMKQIFEAQNLSRHDFFCFVF